MLGEAVHGLWPLWLRRVLDPNQLRIFEGETKIARKLLGVTGDLLRRRLIETSQVALTGCCRFFIQISSCRHNDYEAPSFVNADEEYAVAAEYEIPETNPGDAMPPST